MSNQTAQLKKPNRTYPEYVDSGIEWIGNIPKGWEVKKLKYISEIVLGKMLQPNNSGIDELKPYLRAQNIGWLKVDTSDVKEMWLSKYEINKYCVKNNDLLVSEGGEVGRTAIWNDELPECHIQNSVNKVTVKKYIEPRFLLYVFYSFGYAKVFDYAVNRVSIGHLTREKLKEISFQVPPKPEQQKIADYLDEKVKKIEDIVAKKRKQIALLKEKRAATTARAVTRGLDPDVELVDSGVEWIGKIPKGWKITKVGRTCFIGRGRVISREVMDDNGKYPIYSSQTEKEGVIGYLHTFDFDGEYLTWTTDGANAGTVFYRSGRFNCTNVCGTLRPKTDLFLPFLRYALSVLTKRFVRLDINPKLMNNVMARLDVMMPVSIGEQKKIANYLDEQNRKIDSIIQKIEQSVQLLQEYKTSLISSAVRGRVKVS